jgi:hypothetical protein
MLHSKRFGAAVLTVVALTIGAPAHAGPAGATTTHGAVATPANSTPHPWTYDGCSNSPEHGPGWDFHHACIHHDGCYRGHWASRTTCDAWFHRDMRASCRVLHRTAWGRWPCYGVAAVYYGAVRAFGGPAYAHHAVDVPVR